MDEVDASTIEAIITSYRKYSSWNHVAHVLGLDRTKLYRIRQRYDIDSHFKISDDDLLAVVSKVSEEHTLGGDKLVKGILHSTGKKVTRAKLRETLKEANPAAHELRTNNMPNNFERGAYFSPGTDKVWHIDVWLKLGMFGISVKGIIDGFSRNIIKVEAHTCNSGTVLAQFFMNVIQEKNRIPNHIRTDKGGEMRKIAMIMMILTGDTTANPVLVGLSTSNQKIERWWRDCRRFCLQLYKGMFHHLETLQVPNYPGKYYLDRSNKSHIFVIHYLFLNRINMSLKNFTEMWNNHRLRLPPQFHYNCPITGRLVKSWVPSIAYSDFPSNFSTKADTLLSRITNSDEYCSYLFDHPEEYDDDDMRAGLELSEARWLYSQELLTSVYNHFSPLSISNTTEECKERYIQVIDFINQYV